jgi:hypothetical protein
MANFTDEAKVRLKTQLTDANKVSQELVNQSIDDAHAELLTRLDPVYDVTPADDNLVRGETLLAGAHLLQSLASGQAFDIKGLRIHDVTVNETNKHAALMAISGGFEDEAWDVLAPFLLPYEGTAEFQADATDTVPILGEADDD